MAVTLTAASKMQVIKTVYNISTESATMRAVGECTLESNGNMNYVVDVYKIAPEGAAHVGKMTMNNIGPGPSYSYTMEPQYRAEAMELTDKAIEEIKTKQAQLS